MVEEGLALVWAVRDRYDGHVRNPFNEYECGSYYARAMASYALLGSLSGFRYSAATKTLWFGPKSGGEEFRTFFSTAGGFGTVRLCRDALAVEMIEGEPGSGKSAFDSRWGATRNRLGRCRPVGETAIRENLRR